MCPNQYTYESTIEKVKDSDRLAYRRGDIISIPDRERWPKYARGQLAVILERYRTVNNKYGTIYYNYGAVIMMLTGSEKGRTKRFNSFIYSSMKYI